VSRHFLPRLSGLLILLPLQSLVLAQDYKLVSAKDENVQTAGAAYAPLEVSKHAADPSIPLSRSQRDELLGEFKGLVHMGLHSVTFDQWEGKDMADCDKPQNPNDRWSYRCEIITGQGNGFYYFYPNESRRAVTLQQLDVRVDGSDEKLLDDFRRPVQDLFGRASFVEKPAVRAKPTGLIRHWTTANDIAELFIDHSSRPEGCVRFVWMRAPLVSGAQANASFRRKPEPSPKFWAPASAGVTASSTDN